METLTTEATDPTTEASASATVPTKTSTVATNAPNKRPAATKVSGSATKASGSATKASVAATTTASGAATTATKEPANTPATAATKATSAVGTKAPATESTQAAGHEHTFGDWALQEASTCVVAGKEVRRCSECGFAENRALALEEHKLNGTNLCKSCRKVIFDDDETLVELGVVCDGWYGSGNKACYVWDIKCWNGKVYRGAGDYDKNSGATTILAYDIANRIWDTSYKAKDEAIHGFVEIGGKLVAPGIDSTENRGYGNYYVLEENGTWQKSSNISGGIHNFDMIECDGKIFAGMGTDKVGQTVAVSEDGGKTFRYAPLYKDGQLYDLSEFKMSRTYEFVKLDDTVYALVYFQTKTGYVRWAIFGYEDGKMHYMADGTKLMDGSTISRKYFSGEFERNGTCYLTALSLYAIKDFSDPTSWQKISMPNSGKVSDAILHDGAIYVLSSRQDMKTKIYHVVIYKSTTGEPGSFEEVASYDHSGFPMSFDYDGEHFYVGTGINQSEPAKAGMVLRVTPQK